MFGFCGLAAVCIGVVAVKHKMHLVTSSLKSICLFILLSPC